jgi:fibronectin-binding autotransporter adhesin
MKNISKILLISILFTSLVAGVSASTLQGFQGGTGIATSTAIKDNNCLVQSSSSPYLTWVVGSCGGTPTGLTVANFATSSISQWANNANYISDSSTPAQGDMLWYTGTTWDSVAGNPLSSTLRFLSSFNNQEPTWQTVPAAGSLSYFLQNVSSTGLPTYRVAAGATGTNNMVSSTVAGVGAVSTTIGAWLTPSSTPNLTNIPAGIWDVHLDATKTAGNRVLTMYVSVFKYSAGVETILFDTQQSQIITGADTANPEEIDLETYNSAIVISSTDRLGMRVYGVTTGGSQATTYQLYYQGITQSRLSLPGNTIDATNFVPYVGATANVNLGSFNLLTTGIVSSSQLYFINATGSGNLQSAGITFANATGTGNLRIATINPSGLSTLQGMTFTNATGTGNLQIATFNSTGNGNVSGTLNVTGVTGLQSFTFANATGTGNLQTATFKSTGNANVSGTLNVTGNSLFSGTLGITGVTTMISALLTNATGTGTFDFGGATSLEIVNGTNPTVDIDGEIALDTTANQLILYGSSSVNVYNPIVSLGTKTILNPTSSRQYTIWKIPANFTITEFNCGVDTTSAAMPITLLSRINGGTATATLTTSMPCGSNDYRTSTFINSTITSTYWLGVTLGTASGTPASVFFSIEGRWTRQ